METHLNATKKTILGQAKRNLEVAYTFFYSGHEKSEFLFILKAATNSKKKNKKTIRFWSLI